MEDITIGAEVRLKSGGPLMKVIHIVGESGKNHKPDSVLKLRGYDDGDVICEWITAENKPAKQAFKAVMLCPWDIGASHEEEEEDEDEENEDPDLHDRSDEEGEEHSEEATEELNLDSFDFDSLFGDESADKGAKTEEKPKEDDINLDSINFDDLFGDQPASEEKEAKAEEAKKPEEGPSEVGEIDLGSINFDDLFS